jgi:inner membrane protein
MIGVLHLLFASVFSLAFGLNPYFTLFGSVFPDIEFLFGLEHRAMFHSIFVLLFVWFFIFFKNKRYGTSFFVGFISHLFLDLFSSYGVKILYPLSDVSFYIPVNVDFASLFVFSISVVLIYN